MQVASHCYPLLHFSGRGRSSKLSNHTSVKFLSLNRIPQKFDFNLGAQIQKVLKPSKLKRFCVIPNSNDGYPSLSVSEEDTTTSEKDTSTVEEWENGETFLSKWSPPRYLWRGLSVLILAGQVIVRIIKGKIHWRNTLAEMQGKSAYNTPLWWGPSPDTAHSGNFSAPGCSFFIDVMRQVGVQKQFNNILHCVMSLKVLMMLHNQIFK